MRNLLYFLIVLLMLLSNPINAQDQPSPEDIAAMREQYQKLSQPGDAHKLLASLEGNWQQEIKFYPAPGAEPMYFTGKSVNSMMLGGRFLKIESKGGEGDMYMESVTIMGYDNRYGQYTTVGFDTWGTYYIVAVGEIAEDGKTIVMSGADTDPIMGMDQVYDIIVTIESDDKYISEVVFKNEEITQGAEEFKAVEVINTKVK
jgi:Protein of unknown function (DUF1579)